MYVTTLENKTKTAAFTPYQPEGKKKIFPSLSHKHGSVRFNLESSVVSSCHNFIT